MNLKSGISKAVLLSACLVVFATVFGFTSEKAQAGRMKDLHLQHMEALAQHLFGSYDTDLLETRNTKFVPAGAGFFVAVSSEVSLYSWRHDTFLWIPCVTQFEKTVTDDVTVKKVSCEAFD